jgi:penicillin-binding protein 2
MNWQNTHEINRRANAGKWVIILVFCTLVLAFFRVQILSSERYQLQSKDNRLRAVPLPSPRGVITDRNGVVLAENLPGYSIAMRAPNVDSMQAYLGRLRGILGLDDAALANVVARYESAPSEEVLVRRDASFAMVSALEEQRAWNPGLVVRSEPKRRYPFADTTAHIIGYVSEITEGELSSGVIGGARSGMLVGRVGLEQQYDADLRGDYGRKFIEHDALGRTVRDAVEEETLDPRPGKQITTTIDIALQRYVVQQFPPNSKGAVVAMDPRNGEVLALYSAPSYDPNLFVNGVDPRGLRQLLSDVREPLFNRAIQGTYPPASPWKLAIAAMAMKRGHVDMDTRMMIPCTGGMQYYTRYFRCWSVEGHGHLTLREAIAHSCDVYFYQLGLILGLNDLLHDTPELGLTMLTGIDLPNENVSIFPPSREYYNNRYGRFGWTNAVTLNLAIGQGENAQTVLNMTRFFAGLANLDGVAPTPYLRLDTPPGNRQDIALGLNPTSLSGLRDALVAVVEEGTATLAQVADLRIAGKTGTAQNSHGPNHGWFIGFAPVDDPQIVVGAIVEFAEHGTAVAPLVSRILARYLKGPDAPRITGSEFAMPADSAPESIPLLPDTSLLNSGRRDR